MQGYTQRAFSLIERCLRGTVVPGHRIDDIELHRAIEFPQDDPEMGHCVTIRDDQTGHLHGVAFRLHRFPDAPDDILPMEAFSFDPEVQKATIGVGFLRRLGQDCVQMGFLEVIEYTHENEDWTKIGHEKPVSPEHPLIDSAMASWKLGARAAKGSN